MVRTAKSPNIENAKRVAVYARCSTSDKQNPEVQLAELRRFCAARGWTVTHEIIDQGYSGSTSKRPGLRQLEALIRARGVDAVVVVKLDRLFRSLRHLVAALDEYEALGVQFAAIRDAVDYSTPSGRFFAQVLGSLAQFERELIRERVQAGVDYARAKGKRLGRPPRHDAKRILALRAEGCSYAEIERLTGAPRGTVCRVLAATRKSHSDEAG